MQNNDEILVKKLEELNKEYLDSEYYQLGKYISYLRNLIKKRRFIKLSRLLFIHLKKKKGPKVQKEIKSDIQNLKCIIEKNNDFKIVIYTCITGNYDNIEEPLLLEQGCDYILFSNNKDIQSINWKIQEIPENIMKLEDNAKINRYIKMHPKQLFKDYDYAIYIDGNIKIVSELSQLIKKINRNTGLAIHRHCANTCVFDEVKTCRAYGKGNYKKLRKQVDRYKKEGFPKNYGMLECNILVSDLKNNMSEKIFDEWWNEYINSESMRDQIALPYVLWRNKILVNDIGMLGNNVNVNPVIKINPHI